MSLPFKTYGTKTPSVHGGAGGQGTHISSPRPELFYGYSWSTKPYNDLYFDISANEKVIMQNLNDRLASYIQEVNSLENTNAELEGKIMEWCASHSVVSHEYSGFLATIESLKDQIQHMYISNGEIFLNIENASLVAYDLKNKCEHELTLCTDLEKQNACARKLMDDLTLIRSNLEMEYESLREESIVDEREHEEKKAHIHAQAECQVNVSVDAAPSTDLNETLTKIREQYEAVAAKNGRVQETWYQSTITMGESNFGEETKDLENMTTEWKHLENSFHKKQIELQTQLNLRMSLDARLLDSETHYAEQITELQEIISKLELELEQIRARFIHNQQESDTLLEVKTRLEDEIKQYQLLIEGKDSDPKVAKKKFAVVKVVESRESDYKYITDVEYTP